MRLSMIYGVILGVFFMLSFLFFGPQLSMIFLHQDDLIMQTSSFLRILCLSAPALGIINMVTSYFQALGKALQSLSITIMRNAVLFIPAVMILNRMGGLQGVIAAQPVVEGILMIICIILYGKDKIIKAK